MNNGTKSFRSAGHAQNPANKPQAEWLDGVTEPGTCLFSHGSGEPRGGDFTTTVFRLVGSKKLYATQEDPHFIQSVNGMHGRWKKQ